MLLAQTAAKGGLGDGTSEAGTESGSGADPTGTEATLGEGTELPVEKPASPRGDKTRSKFNQNQMKPVLEPRDCGP